MKPADHREILKFEPGKSKVAPYLPPERPLIKKFSLETKDILGAIPGNLKYKDKGKKKANFFPNNDLYKDINQYYNIESLGGGNSVMDVMLRDDKGLKNHNRKLQEQRSLPSINRSAVARDGNWQPNVHGDHEDKGKVGNFTTPEYKLKNIISQSNVERHNRNALQRGQS